MTTALGIEVPGDLLQRWREWFAPALQPFPTGRLGHGAADVGRRFAPDLSVRDTFHVYDDEGWTWLTESEFPGLDLRTRRALLHGRAATGRLREVPDHARVAAERSRVDTRVVWWPTLLGAVGDRPLIDYVENGLPDSRHRQVTSARWDAASRYLPGAQELAGRLPTSSGPNCFGNVLAAAGATTTVDQTPREPFEAWLGARTTPVRGARHDHRPGVVLVWRDHDGLAEHAAVTIGGGHTLNKPSQGWFSPHLVWTVPETVAASRYRGVVLHRYLMDR